MLTLAPKSFILAPFFALWFGAVSIGSMALWHYKNTPSAEPLAPLEWPAASRLPLAKVRPTLLVFMHPRCACSRATLGELQQILAHAPGLASIELVFFRPAGTAAGWARGDLWTTATELPEVRILEDEGGKEARLFHAETSGHVVLYDARGMRRFDGGITAARGHVGDNAGMGALLAWLLHHAPAQQHNAVFGCRIAD